MTEVTVTMPVKEYERLKLSDDAINSDFLCINAKGQFGVWAYYLVPKNEANANIVAEMQRLEKDIIDLTRAKNTAKECCKRTWLQRILNIHP